MKRFLTITLLILLPPVLYAFGLLYGLPAVIDEVISSECAATGICIDHIDYTPNPLGIAFAVVIALPFVAGIATTTHSLFHRIMQKHV